MKNGKKMYLLILSAILTLSVIGCNNDQADDELQAQIDNLEFELVVLDESGKEKFIFDQGTNTRLALLLNNKSGKDFSWEYTYGCRIMQQEDFLLVYKIANLDNGGSEQPIAVGRPYSFPANCLDINLPPKKIPPGKNIVISANWNDLSENSPLVSGKYFTEFSYVLNIDGRNKSLDLRLDFEIR